MYITVTSIPGCISCPTLITYDKLKSEGKALYSCMLGPDGGVIDDLIVYFLSEDWFRMVVNAATTENDIAWIQAIARDFKVEIAPRFDLGMIAVQGPNARAKAGSLLPEGLRTAAMALKPFSAAHAGDWFVGRTGYTGEDGFEVVLPEVDAPATKQPDPTRCRPPALRSK